MEPEEAPVSPPSPGRFELRAMRHLQGAHGARRDPNLDQGRSAARQQSISHGRLVRRPREEAISRIFTDDVVASVLKQRVAFIEDAAWNALGLPRERGAMSEAS
jgi:hypothetical protein